MPEGKFIPVIGYTTQKRTQMVDDGSGKQVAKEKEDTYFFCIGTSGKLFRVAEYNCNVMVDEKAEIDSLTIAAEICGKLSKAVENCNVLLKYLSGQAADVDRAVKDVENGG
jgi:hypothetical protein